jgi:hypothetical protein
MSKKLLFFSLLTIFVLSIFIAGQTPKIDSVYTSLDAKKCKTLESSEDEAGWYRGECRGISGYKLQVTEGDIRQSIDVISPRKKKYELDFTVKVSSGFSSLGEKAEWRVTRKGKIVTPIALIVRYNASENPENSSINTSYLVVSKITKNQICITNVVKPSANANQQARAFADIAATKPCMTAKN